MVALLAELPTGAFDAPAVAAGSALAGAGEDDRQPEVLLQKRPMFPRGCSRRKPELSYQQHSQSAGPCRQLSSGQWVLSERLSIERADIDWKCESALARSHQLQPLRGIHCSLENQKCSSPGRRSRCLPDFQMMLSMVRLLQLVSALAGADEDDAAAGEAGTSPSTHIFR